MAQCSELNTRKGLHELVAGAYIAPVVVGIVPIVSKRRHGGDTPDAEGVVFVMVRRQNGPPSTSRGEDIYVGDDWGEM